MADNTDTICECNHWFEEHDGECQAPGCECISFVFDPEANTAAAIADRGGCHELSCRCAFCKLIPS